MERRAFLAAAGLAAAGAGTASAGAGIGSVAQHSCARAAGAEALVVRSYLTAIPQAAAQCLAETGAGHRLRLSRAAHRRFDPQSVEVRNQAGELLGYLPGRESRILAPLLAHGLPLEARVVARRTEPRPGMDLDIVLST
jgi:hypothetical protein